MAMLAADPSGQGTGMARIARLETFHSEFVCFVRVTAEDGAFGWGQTST